MLVVESHIQIEIVADGRIQAYIDYQRTATFFAKMEGIGCQCVMKRNFYDIFGDHSIRRFIILYFFQCIILSPVGAKPLKKTHILRLCYFFNDPHTNQKKNDEKKNINSTQNYNLCIECVT